MSLTIPLLENTFLAQLAASAVLAQASVEHRTELEWTYMPKGLGVFLLIAIVAAIFYAVYYVYRREIDTCPSWAKTLLATLRAAVFASLAIIFLGPSMIPVESKTIHPLILLLRDASHSMNTVDRWADPATAEPTAKAMGLSAADLAKAKLPRTKIVDHVLDDSKAGLISSLRGVGRVRVVDFGDQRDDVVTLSPLTAAELKAASEPDATEKKPSVPNLVAKGRGTDLTDAIRASLEGETPAAIIVVGDGQSTVKSDPREAAREAKERGAPLLFVGIGDSARPSDLRVASVYARPQVWSQEPFEIEALLAAEGLPSGEVPVELFESRVNETDGSRSAPVSVARVSAKIPEGGGRARAAFSRSVTEPGRYVYTVKAETQENELSEDDNQLESQVVKVLHREKVRVLLIAGAPTWEYRMVEKLLQREENMLVSCWLQTLDEGRAQEGTRPITRLPANKEELFWYDVVLMFDPNPQEFDAEWLDLLKQFAGEHAGGVLYMAGPKYTGVFLTNQRTKALREILPVRFGDIAAIEMVSWLTTNSQAWPLKVAPSAVDHPVMSFFGERARTLKRWETLPGIFWSFPAVDIKPTAQALLEHSDPALRSVEGPRPLLVTGRYGPAQVVYLGFNGTWRWRKVGNQAEFFDKFWVQTVRHLVEGRSLEGRRRGVMQTDRDRYEIGDRVVLTARLQDPSYQPLVADKVEVLLTSPGDPDATVTMLPSPTQPGAFETTFAPRKIGAHSLKLKVPGSEDLQLEAPFQVELPSAETNQVWLNTPLMEDLAQLSGGKVFTPAQVADVAAAISEKPQVVEIRGQPTPLWDSQPVLWVLVALLCVEWFVRKQYRLL